MECLLVDNQLLVHWTYARLPQFKENDMGEK